MNFGWFKLVSEFLLNFMNLINSWVHDYGWSIVILTAVRKGVLWPLQNKANKSMRKMSALAPKMQELKEKYKDDPTRMNQEVMKLYKEHGVNPVGGCLPMLIQIPIFFGLFTMLDQAAELRNARSSGWTIFPAGHGGPHSRHGLDVGLVADQHPPAPHGRDQRLAHAHDAEDRRRHAAPRAHVHAGDLLNFLLQFRGGPGIILHDAKPVHYPATLANQKQPAPVLEKVAPPGRVKSRAKDDHDAQGITRHDARLPRLRGADRRDQSEGGNQTLQIYMEESHTLIGRDGETLEAIQFLLNRLIQAKDKDAPKVMVDCEHYRAMREDRIVQRVRELASASVFPAAPCNSSR